VSEQGIGKHRPGIVVPGDMVHTRGAAALGKPMQIPPDGNRLLWLINMRKMKASQVRGFHFTATQKAVFHTVYSKTQKVLLTTLVITDFVLYCSAPGPGGIG
jgi:hypothetical protein